MARPAAEIDPQESIFSSSWILPGPMRLSESRSMRTLSEGNGLVAVLAIRAGYPVSPAKKTATRAPTGDFPPGFFGTRKHRLFDPSGPGIITSRLCAPFLFLSR